MPGNIDLIRGSIILFIKTSLIKDLGSKIFYIIAMNNFNYFLFFAYLYYFLMTKPWLFAFEGISPGLLIPEKGAHWLFWSIGVFLLPCFLIGGFFNFGRSFRLGFYSKEIRIVCLFTGELFFHFFD